MGAARRLIFIMAVIVMTTGSGVYRWVDADGNVHFSSNPPPEVIVSAESTGISTSASRAGGNPSVDLPGFWLGSHEGMTIALDIRQGSMSWKEFSPGRYGRYLNGQRNFSGPVKIERDLFTFTMLDAYQQVRGQRQFRIRMQDEETLELVGIHQHGVYRLTKRPYLTRPLSPAELDISGDWAEVDTATESQVLGRIRFEDGIFNRYRVAGNERINGSPAEAYREADGRWRVEEGVLYLDHWMGEKSYSDKLLKSEKWTIREVTLRRLLLANPAGNRLMIFRRERTQ